MRRPIALTLMVVVGLLVAFTALRLGGQLVHHTACQRVSDFRKRILFKQRREF